MCMSFLFALSILVVHLFIVRYCQMALWGALVKPSSKDISCKFIANQLASSLLTATGELTSSLGNKLGSMLNMPSKGAVPTNPLTGLTTKQTGKKSSVSSNKQHGGLLGAGIV